MPLYEYLCGSCGHRFERIQKFSDAPVSECPSCGAAQVERLISSPAIQFKGTGWYITDYARSKSSDGSGSASSSSRSADTSGSSSGSSETTTAKAEA